MDRVSDPEYLLYIGNASGADDRTLRPDCRGTDHSESKYSVGKPAAQPDLGTSAHFHEEHFRWNVQFGTWPGFGRIIYAVGAKRQESTDLYESCIYPLNDNHLVLLLFLGHKPRLFKMK